MGAGIIYLSEPKTTKELANGSSGLLEFASADMQGWRKSMEDAHVNQMKFDGDPNSALFAVFDGHGGNAILITIRQRSC